VTLFSWTDIHPRNQDGPVFRWDNPRGEYVRANDDFDEFNIERNVGRWLQRDSIDYQDSVNLYQFCGNNPVNGIDEFGLKINIKNKSGKKLDIEEKEVIDVIKKQIKENEELSDWFNNMLSNKDKTIDDILTGDLDVDVYIFNPPWYEGGGQTKWEGVFLSSWPNQPNQSIALKYSLFNYHWYRTNKGDKRRTAKTLIHELSHWVEAYSIGKIWPNNPHPSKETGRYIETLIRW